MAEPTRTAEAGEILRIARIVWPEGSPRLVDRSDDVGSDTRFAVIPNLARPRLLAPVEGTGAGARAMLEANDALTARQRMSRTAAWAALTMGAGRRARTLLAVADGHDDSLQAYLEEVLGEPLAMVLGIGTPRANRKPVVRLNSAAGSVIGFAKVGINPLTNELVRREHAALQELAARQWRLIRPPAILHFGTWRGHDVLVLTPVPTRFRPLPPRHLRPPIAAAAELACAWGVRQEALAASPFLARLSAQAEALRPVPAVAELQEGLAGLADRFGDQRLTFGAWHGDFTPWNMVAAHGRLSLWDWEQFAHDVPLGFDALHYEVNVRTHRLGMTEEAVLGGLATGTADLDARGLGAAYLGAIATRYTLGEQESTEDVVHRAAALMRRLCLAEVRGGS